jgi:hypothetical protein
MLIHSFAVALLGVAGSLAACGSPVARVLEVDCGTYDAGYGRYDDAGRDCFWSAYSARRSATWGVTQRTIEGDPIPSTITYDPTIGVIVTRDVRPDRFSGQAHRRVWTWRCDGVTKLADTADEAFLLAGCKGDGTSSDYQSKTHFP